VSKPVLMVLLLAGIGLVAKTQLPEIQRYLSVRKM
jgi:hypothetical protein